MGLFDIFKSDKKETNETSNVPTNELKFDLNKLLSISETYETKRKLTKYICPLDKTVLNIFDSIIIIINSLEKKIEPNDTVSIVLFNSKKELNHSQAAHVINTMAKNCKVTNENWRDIDSTTIEEEHWRGRTFLDIKGSSVFIMRDDELGFNMTITNYYKFLTLL